MKNTREFVDATTLTECQQIQEYLCGLRRAHTEFMNDAAPWPIWILYHREMESRFVKLESRMLKLGILKELIWTDAGPDLDAVPEGSKDIIDNDFLVFSLKALAAVHSHIVLQLQLETAFRCTSKKALLALQEIDTPNRLFPATSLEVPLITIVASSNKLERHDGKLKTPRRLMSKRTWQRWREQIQIEVKQRYPGMHVRVCIQPFGDRLFHNSKPQQCSIVIWESLEIVAFITDRNRL